MTVSSIRTCVWNGLLSAILAAAAVVVIWVFCWGRIVIAIGPTELRIGHPNEALVLLLLAGVWLHRRKTGQTLGQQLQALEHFLQRHERILPWVLMAGAVVYLTRIKLAQHFTFHTGAFDLAMYDTAIRNTLHGNFMFADQLGRNFFSEHFSPILLLLCPLYSIADTPVTALLAEVVCVAGAGWFIYRICRHYALPVTVACLTALLFLNYKYLARGVMFDFHPEMMLPLFLLACVYALLQRRWWLYAAGLVLALMGKEDVAIYTLGLGVYALFARETRIAGLATCAVSLVWAAAAWFFIIPGAMPHDAEVSHFVTARWGHLGTTYSEVALALVTRPVYVAARLFSEAPVEMMARLLFVPLLGFEMLCIALPGVILNTTTTFDMQSTLSVHYAAPIVPFVFWGFIVGLTRLPRIALLCRRPERLRHWGIGALALWTAATFGADYNFYGITPRVLSRYRVMAALPSGRRVSCGTGFVPHLTRRAEPYCFPVENNRAVHYRDCDYILVDREGNPWPLEPTQRDAAIETLMLQTNRYPLIISENGVLLFKTR